MKWAYCLLFVGLALWLVGCGPNNRKAQAQVQPSFILGQLIDSCLVRQPGAMNNDVSRSILADSLKNTIQQYRGLPLPFLAELPVQYEMCLEYPPNPFDFETSAYKNAGKYVVKFGFGQHTSGGKISEDYETTFQIFTVMDKSQVASLIDNAIYSVSGIFTDFANNSQETGFVLPSGKCLIDYPSVTSTYNGLTNKPYINLGTLIIKDVEFTQYNRQSVLP